MVVLGSLWFEHGFLGYYFDIGEFVLEERQDPALLHAPLVQGQSLAEPRAHRD